MRVLPVSTSTRIEGVCFVREWPNGTGQVTFWCPGCESGHTIQFGSSETWTWDGRTDRPTFEPSVLALSHGRSFDEANPEREGPIPPQPRCHSFVRDGRIEYLSDSDHALAGQTVDMVPLPERYAQFLAD